MRLLILWRKRLSILIVLKMNDMERKIGEIFEYNGDWYQCVEQSGCAACSFRKNDTICHSLGCSELVVRDSTPVIFKKLEKVGEPMEFARGTYFQRYRLADSTVSYKGAKRLFTCEPAKEFVYIEIKQNKEDIHKINLPKDGDFVSVKAGYEHIAIFKKEVGEDMYVYANWNMSFSVSKIIMDDSTPLCCISDIKEIRPATEREKKILIDQLAKVNKKWNPETKAIEDVRWRAEPGFQEYYYYLGSLESYGCAAFDKRTQEDDDRYNSGNYFKTREAAEKVAEQIREIFRNSKAE